MKNKWMLLGCVITMLGVVSCIDLRDKDEDGNPIDTLPPKSKNGLNSMGFMLNDEVWLPQGGTLGAPHIIVNGNPYGFGISAQRRYERTYGDVRQSMSFGFGSLDSTILFQHEAPYHFKPEKDGFSVRWRDYNDACMNSDELEVRYENLDVVLTYINSDKQIIAGEFSFDMIVADCDTFKITDGRFDVKL